MNIDHAAIGRLVDPDWYRPRHVAPGPDLATHYLTIAMQAGYDPNPLVDGAWYCARYPDAAASGLHPVEHWVAVGWQLGYDPGPFFSTEWYLQRAPDVAAARIIPLEHYLHYGRREGRDPGPLFDSTWYFEHYPEARPASQAATHPTAHDAFTHWYESGVHLGYSPNRLFDPEWYAGQHADLFAPDQDPLRHYLAEGAAMGLDPAPGFDAASYVERHPASAPPLDTPLQHALRNDKLRGRAGALVPTDRISPETFAAAAACIAAFADREPDLAAIADLETLPIVPAEAPPRYEAWRALYLSILHAPHTIIFTGAIDRTPALAAALRRTPPDPGLLLVELDAETPAIGLELPAGLQWRSLAEFGVGPLNPDDRSDLAAALVNELRPGRVVLWGSDSGWTMLHRHGQALGQHTRLEVVHAATPLQPASALIPHAQACAPRLASIWACPDHHAARSGPHALPLHDVADWPSTLGGSGAPLG